ncbi:MAG: hypothetical protein WC748_02265 [Legionellales bacterium]|jgi:hypothetical protein
MITNLDRQCIDAVIAQAFSVIYLYDRKHPETHEVLDKQLLKLARSTDNTIVNNPIPNELPEHIQLALKDIAAYLYSDNPKRDFFLIGKLPPTLEEIQSYIRSMLFSVSYYMNPDPNAPAPNAYAIDTDIKQILNPRSIKSKKDITYKDAIDHAHRHLNNEENLTVYKQINKPINNLRIEKRKYQNNANHLQSILFNQRLYFLELLNDGFSNGYSSTGPGTRKRHLDNPLEFEPQVEPPLGLLDASPLTTLMRFSVAICFLVTLRYYYVDTPWSRPLWPAGMTDLSQSTANLEQMGTDVTLTSLYNTSFPLKDIQKYSLLTIVSFNIQTARNWANNGDPAYGLKQILEHTHSRINHSDMKFMEIYTSIWAFLAEHGRNVAYQLETYDISLPIPPEHAQGLRALEALRSGMEALLKEKYPEYYAQLSCNNHKDPLQQISALNDLIKLEFESQHNLYDERLALFENWLDMMQTYGLQYPSLKIPSYHNKAKSVRISSFVNKAMRDVMEDKNCPWWQAPLKFVSKTAGHVQETLCAAWKSTQPRLENSNKYYRNDRNVENKARK